LKTFGLQKLCGWTIGKDCYVGPSVFLGMGEVCLEDEAGIGLGNVFRNIRKLHMGRRTMIHHFNWISADGSESRPECGCLFMGEQAAITGRHALDCSGGIIIEGYGGIGGRGCTVITHQLDFVTNVMQHAPVRIGHHSAVNAHVLIAPGCTIAPCVVVGMGAVISQDLSEPYMLYAGVPAVAKKKIDGDWFRRGSSEHDANGSA
jgi:acetyltransferase-like isoleucine patch superfamily enzyme